MTRVLVAGATGRVGRHVVSQLRARGTEVRGLVRGPDVAADNAHGDLTQPESLDPCLEGIDTVFLVWTAPPDTVEPALERILDRVRRIVFLSSGHTVPHPFFQAGQPNSISELHAKIETLIEASGCQWTFLRPGMFSANALWWWAPQIRAGADTIRWPHAAASTAPIDERDIAAVAVRALCEDGHTRAEYVLTGPESLTQRQQLSTIGDAIGRQMRMEDISPGEARLELRDVFTDSVADMLLRAWAAADGLPALVTSTVADVTGAPARTFRDWAIARAAEFSGTKLK